MSATLLCPNNKSNATTETLQLITITITLNPAVFSANLFQTTGTFTMYVKLEKEIGAHKYKSFAMEGKIPADVVIKHVLTSLFKVSSLHACCWIHF